MVNQARGGIGLDSEKFDLKRILLSRLDRKLTLLFIIVALVAPSLAIYYFYIMAVSALPESIITNQSSLLQTAAIMIIILIAVDAGIVGFFVSRSITKPIKELYGATQEVEKGNFNVRADIKTHDEIGELGHAFNRTTAALGKMAKERKEIDSAKSEFLSITSHELRSPMTPMKAQLQMLQNEYFGKLTNAQKNSLNIVIRNADRLDKIIVDFLEISRIEAARLKFVFKETNLEEIIQETVDLMKGSAKEKNVKLKISMEKLPIIELDPDRVIQVLRNLIDNAIKFSKNKSTIEVNAVSERDHILLSVSDHGCGLTTENQMRVFEPFYQVEKTSCRKHGGTGLGLAICRGIVESQKGKIWVESTPDEGCTFHFTIPMKPVRDVEPIKVLFSQKDSIERKLKNAFQMALGPLGIGEFIELKNKNSLWKDDILEHIDSLTGQYILTPKQGEEFKTTINTIFGQEKEVINEE